MLSPTATSPSAATAAPSILLVDDEVAILDGLRRQLRKRFTVHTALSGAAALELLETEPVNVVVSDMRMPEMDGATFLSQVRVQHPDVVRILLTGQADTQSAIAAVNEGSIYRFLTKPCPPDVIVDELASAVELNRLVTAEKELLASTLRRTVDALAATLSLAQPVAFARALRVTATVTELAEVLGIDEPWEVHITAQLALLGGVALPAEVHAKLDAGRPLNEEERAMVDRVPELSRELVAAIPRLEGVAEAIGWQNARFDGAGSRIGVPSGAELPLAARILKVALDFERGMSQQRSVQRTIATLRSDPGAHDPAVLDALAQAHDGAGPALVPHDVSIEDLAPGMVVFDDLLTDTGLLLVGRGMEVTAALVERLENFAAQGRISSTVRVTGGVG
jgi:response regulator RpfG family c-di-GMP phosphodiesterase